MNTKQLSERLAAVASFVPKHAVLADIGSDHAYLPCYLAKQGRITKAIAGEVAQGPMESSLHNVRAEGLEQQIDVRLADGLAAIKAEDQVDTVTIAGMGGTLIATILEEGKARLHTVQRIIAQPNIHSVAVREWAAANGFFIADEDVVKEDGKIYEIIVLDRGTASYTEADLLMGPFLRERCSEVFREKWQRELQEWNRILAALEQAEQTDEIREKRSTIQRKYDVVRKVLEA